MSAAVTPPAADGPPQLLAEVTRRDQRDGTEVVESTHAGHLVVCGPEGAVVAAVGDPGRCTFARSTVKPLQAAACLEVLAAHGWGDDALPLPELAVAWSSHRGEPAHLAAITDLLARSGTPASALTCPPAVPEADPGAMPSRLLHNCSGKHALFALAGSALGVRGPALLDPDAAVQQQVLGVLAAMLGRPAALGVDGCGAPAVAVPLYRLAAGFQRVLTDPRCARVRAAGAAHPLLVGGQGRLESALCGAGVTAKVGAEGVYAVAWHDRAGAPWSLAIKAEDGASRGVGAVVNALLVALGVVAAGTWQPPPPLGGGRPAGHVRPAPGVLDAVVGPVLDAGGRGVEAGGAAGAAAGSGAARRQVPGRHL